MTDLVESAARAAYEREGCWVAPVLFGVEAVERFRGGMDRVLAGEYGRGRAPTLCLPFDPELGQLREPDRLRKIDNAWWADDDLAALATDPAIAAIAADLLGADEVRLWQDQLLWKPPGRAEATTIGWHQDWASWRPVASHPAFVTAWVALDEVDDENGAMQVLPGSHHWGLVEGAGNFFSTDRDGQLATLGADRAVAPRSLHLAPGQVSFHHPLTFHGSGANTSDRLRRSLAVHLVDAAVTAEVGPPGWRHYNLDLLLERGGTLGEGYRFDDLCPLVHGARPAA